ncbi:hypothetical protein [Cellulomonas composti]|uniref:Asparagine synthetase domain-containing protein n=1 Tax=Cellulomonas composti TaxID=266130 RepID=A0A511JAU5_9CELL|nr:hypothetical protein [Cellulomonas composti]GEL94899.1 hypothetical protein CCO02nite_15570 [Cellulomonas composti]
MSNYFTAVVRTDLVTRVEAWLRERGSSPSEEHVERIGPDTTLVVVSAGISDCLAPGRFFRGTAMSPEHGAIAYGPRGWAALPDEARRDPHGVAGTFVLVEWDAAQVVVRRDLTGSVGLAWTSGDGITAASDSLLLLVDLRRWLGLPVTQNTEHLLARAFPNNKGAQQPCEETFVQEVSYAAAGRGLRIPLDTLRGEQDGARLTDRLLDAEVDEVATLRAAAAFVVRTMTALVRAPHVDVRLSFSGGYDSRVLLGGALRGGVLAELPVAVVDRDAGHAPDVVAARGVADRYGLVLGDGTRRSKGDELRPDALGTLASTTLGFYDTVFLEPVVQRGAVGLNGIGAGLLKGGWGWRSISELLPDAEKFVAERAALRAQSAKGVRAAGGEPGWADASELLYAAFRNGIHGAGVSIAVTMTTLRPLDQVALARLGHARVDGRSPRERREAALLYGAQPSRMTGLLALMDPELATLPYETPQKALSPGLVAERLAAAGGPLTPSEIDQPVALLGSPSDVPAGPSQLGLGAARHVGFHGPFQGPELLDLARRGAESVEDAQARLVYEGLLRKADQHVVRRGVEPRYAGPSLGKLLALAMIAGP